MGLGRQYFLRCSGSMGDILVVDSILFSEPIKSSSFFVYVHFFVIISFLNTSYNILQSLSSLELEAF